jgi:hypothetical protein
MNSVNKIPLNRVHQTWPLVEKYFAAVEPHNKGEYTLDQIKMKLGVGDWWLVTFVRDGEIIGALSMLYQNRANARVAFITALGGEGVTTDDNWKQLTTLFKQYGATTVEAGMRPSTYRLWSKLGFVEKYVIAEAKL